VNLLKTCPEHSHERLRTTLEDLKPKAHAAKHVNYIATLHLATRPLVRSQLHDNLVQLSLSSRALSDLQLASTGRSLYRMLPPQDLDASTGHDCGSVNHLH